MSPYYIKYKPYSLFALIPLVVLTLIFGGVQIPMIFMTNINKLDVTAINHPRMDVDQYKNTLTFKMIDFDVSKGIASHNDAIKAKSNVAYFFNSVIHNCSKSTGKDLALCANKILGKYFYYTQSAETSNNYAKQQSDCDLNAYLLYDALNFMGVETYISYSPGHAFISLVDNDRKLINIETTHANNNGKLADMRESLYVKTNHKYYYAPKTGDDAFAVYQALVYHLSTDKNYIENLPNLKTNPIVSDFYYRHLQLSGKLSSSDVNELKHLLESDRASTEKKIIIANWYLSQGQDGEARKYVGMIDNSSCDDECVTLKISLKEWPSFIESAYKIYLTMAKANATEKNFILFLFFIAFLLSTVVYVFLITDKKS